MSIWQLMKGGVPTGDMLDDELPGNPGEPDFSVAAVVDLVSKNPTKYDGFNWVQESQ